MTDRPPRNPFGRAVARLGVRRKARRSADRPSDAEFAAIDERLKALEAMVEGLQDALYRQAVHHDSRIDDLTRRIAPEELARSLSADARKRGL